MTKLECPIPFMGSNCTETYAQHAGRAYDIYQALHLTYGLMLFVITTIQNIRLFRIRGVKWSDYRTSVIHQMFLLSWIISVTLVIRGTDPNGWADRNPQWLQEFCLGTGTSSAYNLGAIAVLNWINIIRAISGRSPDAVLRATRIIVIVWYLWVFITNTLYSTTTPAYLYSSLNVSFNIIMNIIIISAGWFYGGSIYIHLSHSATRETGTTTTTTTSTTSPVRSSSSLRTNRSKVRVILHLMIALTIVSLIAIAAQLYALADNIRIKYQTAFYTTEDYPTFTFSDILVGHAAFPIGQGLIVIVVMGFYRKLRSSDSSARSHSTPSKHSRDNTVMTFKETGASPHVMTPTRALSRALSRQPSNMDLGTGHVHPYLSRQPSSIGMLDTREVMPPAAMTSQHRPQPSMIPSIVHSDAGDSQRALLINVMSSPTQMDTIQPTPASKICAHPHNVSDHDDVRVSVHDIRLDVNPPPSSQP